MLPARKASGPLSALLSRSTARKLDSRASASGVAQGSLRLVALPLRASSRRISRAQSSAPVSIQPLWWRLRSAVSTCTARHCCHTMPAASVATTLSSTIATSKAAPRAGRGCFMAWAAAARRA